MIDQHAQRLGDAAMTLSVGSATVSWLSIANELAQLLAALVAIISGCFAIFFYLKQINKDK